jgi:hypothetical protein
MQSILVNGCPGSCRKLGQLEGLLVIATLLQSCWSLMYAWPQLCDVDCASNTCVSVGCIFNTYVAHHLSREFHFERSCNYVIHAHQSPIML